MSKAVSLAVTVASVTTVAACSSGGLQLPPTPEVSVLPGTQSASATAAPTTLKGAYEQVKGSVVRVQTAECGGYEQGTGFVIGPNHVATAGHVVEKGQAVRVILGTVSTNAQVVGIDHGVDVALLRTTAALDAAALPLATKDPEVGDQVAGIGYTLGDPLSFKTGTVNGLGRKAVIEGVGRHSLIEFDAATNPGNSGGPVIDPTGQVVGLVDAGPEGQPGQRLAVSARMAGPLLTKWRSSPKPKRPTSCPQVPGPNGGAVPPGLEPTGSVRQALQTLDLYFSSINKGDFPTALAQLAQPPSQAKFTEAVTSSQDRDFKVTDVRMVKGAPVVWLSFVSQQESGRGPQERRKETCTRWVQDYYFVEKRGVWLIEKTAEHPGTKRNAPC